MPSLFSRLGRRSDAQGESGATIAPTAVASPASARPVEPVVTVFSRAAPTVEQTIDAMLDILRGYLPAPVLNVPEPTATIKSVSEKPLAIGNDRGLEQRGLLGLVALKGGRLDAVVRLQIWSANPAVSEAAIQNLQQQILTDKLALQAQGFLKLAIIDTTTAENVSALSAWRSTTELKVLYEFHYDDNDGAESIIARIPIHTNPETRNSPDRENNLLTDAIVRWDDEASDALTVAGGANSKRINGFASLAYVPGGWFGNSVTLSRLQRDNAAAPTSYPDLMTFLIAVSGDENPDRHAEVVFPDVASLLVEMAPIGAPIGLGDWDEDGVQDLYQSALMNLSPPIVLQGGNEILQLSYQDAALDSKAVIYLRFG